jgi:hypothetical protein
VVHRVLDEHSYDQFSDYVAMGGGRGFAVARSMRPAETIDVVTASGLRVAVTRSPRRVRAEGGISDRVIG